MRQGPFALCLEAKLLLGTRGRKGKERKEGGREGGREREKMEEGQGEGTDRRKGGKERRTRRKDRDRERPDRLFTPGGRGISGSASALGTRPLPVSHYRTRPAKMRNEQRRGWLLGLIVWNRSSGAGLRGILGWR